MAATPKSQAFGIEPLGKLLRQQAIPSSIGILVMSIYGIVDTIFVGRWVGTNGIGAITVVLPITYLVASIGMGLGVGGASIISRAMGAQDQERANHTFGNQVAITIGIAVIIAIFGFVFTEEILRVFGGKGEIAAPAKDYFEIVLIGCPFLAWAIMSNNVIRAEGFPRMAMLTLIIPAVVNIALDPVFIVWLDMGMKGAAWATALSYMMSALYTASFFIFGRSGLSLTWSDLIPEGSIVREMFSLGFVTLARQGSVSLFSIVLNNMLFKYGGELGLSIFGIVNRFNLFAIFPILGITQGSVPIIGFNYGAEKWFRVKKMIRYSVRSATISGIIIFLIMMLFTPALVRMFTTDQDLIEQSVPAMRFIFIMTPILSLNLIGSAYYQAIGRAVPALFLTLSRQIFFLIPLVIVLPLFFGLDGVWYSYPLADFGASALSYIFLTKQIKTLNGKIDSAPLIQSSAK